MDRVTWLASRRACGAIGSTRHTPSKYVDTAPRAAFGLSGASRSRAASRLSALALGRRLFSLHSKKREKKSRKSKGCQSGTYRGIGGQVMLQCARVYPGASWQRINSACMSLKHSFLARRLLLALEYTTEQASVR